MLVDVLILTRCATSPIHIGPAVSLPYEQRHEGWTLPLRVMSRAPCPLRSLRFLSLLLLLSEVYTAILHSLIGEHELTTIRIISPSIVLALSSSIFFPARSNS